MCGEPDVIDGYCCVDHRSIHVRETEAAQLRQALLEIVHLAPAGSWYGKLALAAHLRVPRS
jgi:hypothetical protein